MKNETFLLGPHLLFDLRFRITNFNLTLTLTLFTFKMLFKKHILFLAVFRYPEFHLAI